jgi:phosphoglycolate phosphatase-like HAD superfamily hydrolase
MTVFEHKKPDWDSFVQKNFVLLRTEIEGLVKRQDDWCGHQRVANPAVYVLDWLQQNGISLPMTEDRTTFFLTALWSLYGIASPAHAIRAALAAQEKTPSQEVLRTRSHMICDEWQWHQEHPERWLWLWTRVGIRWVPYGKYREHDRHRYPIPES